MTERTIQSIFNLWFWNFQNASIQQFSNLYHSTVAILKYYNKNAKHDEEIKEILPEIFFHPIIKLKEKYPDLAISKNVLDWSIPQLEWCYYRDTKFRTKLGKEYNIDSTKEREKQKITMAEIITVLSIFKEELFERIVKILIDEKIELFITLPIGTKEIEQLGSDSHA